MFVKSINRISLKSINGSLSVKGKKDWSVVKPVEHTGGIGGHHFLHSWIED